jgi:competence protein ComEC
MWGDALATEGDASFAELPGMACSADACVAKLTRDGRSWRLLATLSKDHVARPVFEPACARADIVISARRMPNWCQPRWLRLDRATLGDTGAVAIWLDSGRIATANAPIGDHPWRPQGAGYRR